MFCDASRACFFVIHRDDAEDDDDAAAPHDDDGRRARAMRQCATRTHARDGTNENVRTAHTRRRCGRCGRTRGIGASTIVAGIAMRGARARAILD